MQKAVHPLLLYNPLLFLNNLFFFIESQQGLNPLSDLSGFLFTMDYSQLSAALDDANRLLEQERERAEQEKQNAEQERQRAERAEANSRKCLNMSQAITGIANDDTILWLHRMVHMARSSGLLLALPK